MVKFEWRTNEQSAANGIKGRQSVELDANVSSGAATERTNLIGQHSGWIGKSD